MEKLPTTNLSIAAIPQPGRIPLLAAVYALGLMLFLSIEPTKSWLLVVVALAVALGTDGIVRSHPRSIFRDAIDTAPHLIVPTVVALAAGYFLEDTVVGYWSLLAAVVAGAIMGVVVYAQYVSVDTDGSAYVSARFTLSVFTYLGAFALYAVLYSFELDLVPAAVCAGLASAALAGELFRDPEMTRFSIPQASVRAVGFALAIGLIVAEARWALYFIPLDGFLAAVFMLLVFYVASGLVQHYLRGDLTTTVALEFALVALVGLLMVILGKAFTSA